MSSDPCLRTIENPRSWPFSVQRLLCCKFAVSKIRVVKVMRFSIRVIGSLSEMSAVELRPEIKGLAEACI